MRQIRVFSENIVLRAVNVKHHIVLLRLINNNYLLSQEKEE